MEHYKPMLTWYKPKLEFDDHNIELASEHRFFGRADSLELSHLRSL